MQLTIFTTYLAIIINRNVPLTNKALLAITNLSDF